MKIIGWGNSSGSKYWRIVDPFKYLRKRGHDAWLLDTAITEEAAQFADIYVLNSIVDKEGIALLYAYQQEKGKKIVVDVDDLLHIDPDNPFKKEHEMTQAPEVVKQTIAIADLVTTTNRVLANQLRKLNKNVLIFQNAMDLERWDLPKLKNTSDRIRIGWAGSITHLKDFELVVNPLKRICKDYPNVEIVIVGDMRIKDMLDGCKVEVMAGVPFDIWPAKLHGLRLDIGIAPLRENEFNRCKSNIKWQEYSIAKIPGVYSPTVYNFRGFDGHYGMIAENEDQWYRSLVNLIEHKSLREDIVNHAYSVVHYEYNLAHTITTLEKAYMGILTQGVKQSIRK